MLLSASSHARWHAAIYNSNLARHGLGSAIGYDLLSDVLGTCCPAKDDLHSGSALDLVRNSFRQASSFV